MLLKIRFLNTLKKMMFITELDKSNESKNYKRNKIRSDLIPILSNISENYEEIFYKSFKNLRNLSNTYQNLIKLEIKNNDSKI